jgi:hypothetical protein
MQPSMLRSSSGWAIIILAAFGGDPEGSRKLKGISPHARDALAN